MSRRTVISVWANGFGVWHARVSLPEPGYTWDALTEEAQAGLLASLRGSARRRMRVEIEARHMVGTAWRCAVEPVERNVHGGLLRWVVFREKNPTPAS